MPQSKLNLIVPNAELDSPPVGAHNILHLASWQHISCRVANLLVSDHLQMRAA